MSGATNYDFLSRDDVRPMSDMISKWQGVQKNALDIQNQQAQVEQGKALQAAIDPATGQFDQAKYNQLLATNPAAARGALQAAQGGVTLDTGTYNLHNARLTGAMGAMGQLIADNPDGVPADAMHAAIERQRTQGNLTDQEAQQEHAQVSSNPRANTQLLLQGMGHGLTVQQQLDAAKPPTQTVNVPQGVIPVTAQPQISSRPGGGLATGTGGVAAGVPPGETQEYAFQPVDANGKPTGTPYKVTAPKGTVFPSMQGTQITPVETPAAAGAAANPPGAPVAGSSGIGTGRINPTPNNPALRNPAVAPPPAAAAPSVPGAPTGAVATSLPLGQQPAAEETARASAKMGSDLTARADQVPTNKANYANMLTDLSKLDSMGPGTEKEIAINSVLQKLTGYGFTMTPEQIAAGNSFAKLANIAVGQQLAAIGGTDARQALFMGANPNLDLSKLGNTQIIHMLQGNEDAIQAKSRAWQDWLKGGNGPESYQQFQNDFNHHFDPRVFQQQYMGPSEVDALKASLAKTDGAKQKFVDDVQYARSHGWIR
jgi:hypothetical protein